MVEILYVVCVCVFFLCKPFSSLVELIEIDANFWKELEEIKGTFEKDETLKIQFTIGKFV
jgi:hypothetical protein